MKILPLKYRYFMLNPFYIFILTTILVTTSFNFFYSEHYFGHAPLSLKPIEISQFVSKKIQFVVDQSTTTANIKQMLETKLQIINETKINFFDRLQTISEEIFIAMGTNDYKILHSGRTLFVTLNLATLTVFNVKVGIKNIKFEQPILYVYDMVQQCEKMEERIMAGPSKEKCYTLKVSRGLTIREMEQVIDALKKVELNTIGVF